MRAALITGLLLAALETANIVAEHFLSLRSPASHIVPASAMGLMILCFATSAAIEASSRGIIRSILAAVLTAVVGMTLSCSIGIILIAVKTPEFLGQAISNATTHVIVGPIIAVVVGLIAGSMTLIATSIKRGVLLSIAIGDGIMIAAGVQLLVTAASLPRDERPPLVSAGMLLCALGLAILPSLIVSLRPSTSVPPSPAQSAAERP